MGEATKIEWCDHTASPWYGCQHATLADGSAHPGCEHCYAEAMSKRNPATLGLWGSRGVRVKSKSFLANLRKWNREAVKRGAVESVFPSLCDPFEDWQGAILNSGGIQLWRNSVPQGEEFDATEDSPLTMGDLRREMFATIDECPNVRLLLLTKRPGNVRRMWPKAESRIGTVDIPCRRNVWIGTSISDQPTADALLPELAKLRDLTPCLFVSAEPLLGRVRLGCCCFLCDNTLPGGGVCRNCGRAAAWRGLNQVIIGVESNGPRVGRLGEFTSEADWIEGAIEIVDQCRAAGVAAFVKQIPLDGRVCHDLERFPAALRVREFPASMTGAPA